MARPATESRHITSPFDLENESGYIAWRNRKLEYYSSSLGDLVVEIKDPRKLSAAEHQAMLECCRKSNMVIYAGNTGDNPDRSIPISLGLQFGLKMIDHNWLADDDGLTSLAVREHGAHRGYIPYSNRPIKWHTDGYYNTLSKQIHALLLHCVNSAVEGGENALMDHEIAYMLLRDEDPALIEALMQPDAMTIPARIEGGKVARQEEAGPVFSIHPVSGDLHMRYTARAHNVIWKEDRAVRTALARLESILASDSPYIFRGRLEPGMGLVSNNVLHDRAGFMDTMQHHRLLYRARYYDRLQGTSVSSSIQESFD